jgi:hypothetical protein
MLLAEQVHTRLDVLIFEWWKYFFPNRKFCEHRSEGANTVAALLAILFCLLRHAQGFDISLRKSTRVRMTSENSGAKIVTLDSTSVGRVFEGVYRCPLDPNDFICERWTECGSSVLSRRSSRALRLYYGPKWVNININDWWNGILTWLDKHWDILQEHDHVE